MPSIPGKVSPSAGVERRQEPLRRLAAAGAATLFGSATALLVFRLSWVLLGRSSPVTWSLTALAGVMLAVPIGLAAALWSGLAADFRRFGPPFLLSAGLPIGAVLAVSLYLRSPGEVWHWLDPEWVPWLLASGIGSTGLGLVFVRWPRGRGGERHDGPAPRRA